MQLDPAQLRRLGRWVLDVIALEIAEAEEARQLAAEDNAALLCSHHHPAPATPPISTRVCPAAMSASLDGHESRSW
ncbi:hypothetical protein [Nocardioides sp. NPDC047086]|uniref:hypothetical protein n=1 Tax=Nocardioides sp. NPDC047086 TaxID=3154810 RepID=UPI0033C22D48